MSSSLDLAALRRDYMARGLSRSDLFPDPFQQFASWFQEAATANLPDVNAMSVATVAPDGAPDVRIVLLKGADARGFVFFTNYESSKGRQLTANPRVSLCLFWIQLERQVRIRGVAEKTTTEESETYFHSRPLGSQLGAWASAQSEVIANRAALETKLAEVTRKFSGQTVPLPPHWGGYRVVPTAVEFWQGRADRLHDRFRYQRQGDRWQIERLSP